MNGLLGVADIFICSDSPSERRFELRYNPAGEEIVITDTSDDLLISEEKIITTLTGLRHLCVFYLYRSIRSIVMDCEYIEHCDGLFARFFELRKVVFTDKWNPTGGDIPYGLFAGCKVLESVTCKAWDLAKQKNSALLFDHGAHVFVIAYINGECIGKEWDELQRYSAIWRSVSENKCADMERVIRNAFFNYDGDSEDS